MNVLGELDELNFKKQFVVIFLATWCAKGCSADTAYASLIENAQESANQVWQAIKRV